MPCRKHEGTADSRDPVVDRTVARAAAAQRAFEDWTDQRVHGLLLALAVAFADQVTSPVATAVFKTLISLKARNALILSFPRGCQRVADATGQVIRLMLQANGAPPDPVQWPSL